MLEGFRFGSCDARPAVAEEARRYAAGGRFAQTLEPMLPKMVFVLDEVERRGLPTEFVLLPIVESHYRMLSARGNRPAGPWQMMPGTARAHGIQIRADYDGRLDLAASTHAALDHIERLADRFGDDWTAVVKAYNAGEYRVHRARDGAGAEAAYRGLTATTLTYHARLHALACIVATPERFGIELPAPPVEPVLVAFAVEADLDLDLAAAVSGLDRRAIVAENPGIRGERAPRGSHLVLPAPAVEGLVDGLAAVPPNARAHWRPRGTDGRDWPALAKATGMEPAALAAANGSTLDEAPPARVVVPGAAPREATARSDGGTYVVRAGDSPWTIARRLRVRLADLLSVNGLTKTSVLKPGQELLVP
jgi:membrane-bound lytic murein transglycosylase D